MSTNETVHTHGGTDRRFALCRCVGCGRVERCTPENDFYVRTVDGPNGPLYCQRCICVVNGIPADRLLTVAEVRS